MGFLFTRIGRYLRPEWRAQLAQEIRSALRRQSEQPPRSLNINPDNPPR